MSEFCHHAHAHAQTGCSLYHVSTLSLLHMCMLRQAAACIRPGALAAQAMLLAPSEDTSLAVPPLSHAVHSKQHVGFAGIQYKCYKETTPNETLTQVMHQQHLETLLAHSGLSTMHGGHFDSNGSIAYLRVSAMRNRQCNRIIDDDVTCRMRLFFFCRRRNKKVSDVERQALWQKAKASGCNLSGQLCESSCSLIIACLGLSRVESKP